MRLPFARKKQEPEGSRRATAMGRTSPYAYYSQRSPERAALGRQVFRDTLAVRAAHRAATYWLRRFGLLVIVIAIFLGIYNILGLSTDVKVVPLDSTTTGYLHSLVAYQKAAERLVAGSILNRNKITIDTGGISKSLERQFPELAAVSVSFTLGGHRPIVYVEATKPALVLAGSDGKSYVIDENGRAVSNVQGTTAESLRLAAVQDQGNLAVQIGQPALPSDAVAFIQAVEYQCAQKGVDVSTFVLPAGESELDAYIAGQKYYVKFNLADDSALQQVGTFLAARHDLQGRGTTPGQYIDVRVLGRAYYK